MIKYLALITLSIFLLTACNENSPNMTEGNTIIEIEAVWHSVPGDTTSTLLPMSNAKIIFSSEYGTQVKQADEDGKLTIEGLPSSTYSIACRMYYPADSSIQLVHNERDIKVVSGSPVQKTFIAEAVSSTGIAINEVYCGGPKNSIFYFYDQFIELYNLSDSTMYLDGMTVFRVSGNNEGKGPGADEDDDNDIDGVVYAFKFPGSPGGNDYPFPAKSYVVMASDAVNHTSSLSNSIDLSNADWEFYNQFSSTDIDNPNVPNLSNLRADRTADFLINLVSDVLIIATGVDTVWADGIDIETIIDGIEYQSNPDSRKTLDSRIDRGVSLSPPRYSGQSMQRREPGSDTNDGTLDWETTPHPTPGYHYN